MMQRTDSGLGLVGAYGDESDDELNVSGNKDGVDTISGSDDESGEHGKKHEKKAEKRPPPVELEDSPKPPKLERKATKLVSYGADDVDEESDEDKDGDIHGAEDMDVVDSDGSEPDEEAALRREATKSLLREGNGDIKLPPEPPGRCSKQLQDKILHLTKKVKVGYNLSSSIQNRKDFRNPGIYEKLIQFCKIDEKGTNYPPELFDPAIWGPESFYDELAKAQKIVMDKKEKERKERTKLEFVTGTKKVEPVAEPKRKSKWDNQPAVMPAHVVVPPPPVSITTAATGTKSTVIPAVGTLPKKK